MDNVRLRATAWMLGAIAERSGIHPPNARSALLKLLKYGHVRMEKMEGTHRAAWSVIPKGHDLKDFFTMPAKKWGASSECPEN